MKILSIAFLLSFTFASSVFSDEPQTSEGAKAWIEKAAFHRKKSMAATNNVEKNFHDTMAAHYSKEAAKESSALSNEKEGKNDTNKQ